MKNQTALILGLVFLLDGTSCIKKINKPTKVTVSTFAGSGLEGSADGTGTSASFFHPNRIATDGAGTLYVTDLEKGLIREISTRAVVTTLPEVAFYLPWGLAVDAAGNIYVGDFWNKIYKTSPAAPVTTLAGSGQPGWADGKGTAASFNGPRGMAFDRSGNLYVSDEQNNRIRKITPDGVVTTFAGSGIRGAADGEATTAQFNWPDGIAVDEAGNLYVADSGNHMIRKINPAGAVTTLAGSPIYGAADGSGAAASFHFPAGVALDLFGNLYVADYANNKIRMVSPQGVVTTVAGNGVHGLVNGPGASASFKGPTDLVVSISGDIYVTDEYNNLIRKIAIK